MSLREDSETFYRERVPDQFNRTLEAQRALALDTQAAGDASPADILADMEAVRSSIVVQIDTGETIQRHVFEIERGVMNCLDPDAAAPAHPPFLILGHSLDDFANLRRECGDSLLGFLGGLAGLGDEMRLTAKRVRSLRELAGSLVFERVGVGGFALFAHFGFEAPASEPRATIRIDEATYEQLRAGSLDPQDAFMNGRIEIAGDDGMAIELALAALSPD